jgi:hypothetical protein
MQVSLEPPKHGGKLLYETKLCSHNKQLKAILHNSSSIAPLQPIQHNGKQHYDHQRRSILVPDRVFRPIVKLESKSTSACTTDSNANSSSSNEDEKTEATEEPIMVFTTTTTTNARRESTPRSTLLETRDSVVSTECNNNNTKMQEAKKQ